MATLGHGRTSHTFQHSVGGGGRRIRNSLTALVTKQVWDHMKLPQRCKRRNGRTWWENCRDLGGLPLVGLWDPSFFSSFIFWPWDKPFGFTICSYTVSWLTTCLTGELVPNGANQLWTKISKTVSQNNPFLFIRWLSQVSRYIERNPSNTDCLMHTSPSHSSRSCSSRQSRDNLQPSLL